MDFTLGKAHKLCNKPAIERIFSGGVSLFSYPLRCVYEVGPCIERGEKIKFIISVGKRNHKRAVKRNLIKRRFKEAYRLNRHIWDGMTIPEDKELNIVFIYTQKDILEFKDIENGVKKAIHSIRRNIEASPISDTNIAD